jgi:hypothetical protein
MVEQATWDQLWHTVYWRLVLQRSILGYRCKMIISGWRMSNTSLLVYCRPLEDEFVLSTSDLLHNTHSQHL